MFLSVWLKGNHIINKNISDYERPEVWKSYFYIYTGHFFYVYELFNSQFI